MAGHAPRRLSPGQVESGQLKATMPPVGQGSRIAKRGFRITANRQSRRGQYTAPQSSFDRGLGVSLPPASLPLVPEKAALSDDSTVADWIVRPAMSGEARANVSGNVSGFWRAAGKAPLRRRSRTAANTGLALRLGAWFASRRVAATWRSVGGRCGCAFGGDQQHACLPRDSKMLAKPTAVLIGLERA